MAADSREQTVVVHVTPGEILDGRWRIETRIGQGAMGSVFKGRDLEANKIVAIKILAPEHCRKAKVVARFEREAEKMTSLRHPNIVAFEGHGRRGALPFIVMEFLEGLTLSELLETSGGMVGVPETIALVRQVATGLDFLHRHGLVHRDVKPQNVFLGAGGRVTILDLGVVRDQANPGLTRPGAMVGTPYYMSPEQILGVDDIDARTDVYALSAVAFELLTGRPPYLGNNNFEVLYGHKNSPPPDASLLVKAVPKKLAAALIRGLSKRRDQRPATVTELVEALEASAPAAKVDLARLVPKKSSPQKPTVPRREADVTERAPPLVPKPPSKRSASTEDSVPEAPPAEVFSVSGVPPLAEEAPRSARDERTVIGPAPERRVTGSHPPVAVSPTPTAPTPAMTASSANGLIPVDAGLLRVVVTAKGSAVSAAVFVDGAQLGTSPCTLTLKAGPHQVRIELEGYRRVERWATVELGSSQNLRVFLEKS